jgi:hypothetical protein
MRKFNEAKPHQGKWCFGKTPIQTFLDALPITRGHQKLPLGKVHMMSFELIPICLFNPLRFLQGMQPKP